MIFRFDINIIRWNAVPVGNYLKKKKRHKLLLPKSELRFVNEPDTHRPVFENKKKKKTPFSRVSISFREITFLHIYLYLITHPGFSVQKCHNGSLQFYISSSLFRSLGNTSRTTCAHRRRRRYVLVRGCELFCRFPRARKKSAIRNEIRRARAVAPLRHKVTDSPRSGGAEATRVRSLTCTAPIWQSRILLLRHDTGGFPANAPDHHVLSLSLVEVACH